MTKPILLDTQLIVLLVVGMTSPTIIAKYKNLTAFDGEDFELLLLLLGREPKLAFLPNTISESSNLLRQHRDPERSRILLTFKRLIDANREHYISSKRAAARSEYVRLGITDSAILASCAKQICLLTADLDLFDAAQRIGLDAMNFNHQREDFQLI